MNLEKQIYIRKSCRNYLDEEIDMDLIHEFMKSIKLLNGGVSYRYDILTIDEVNNLARFSAPYYLAIYTDKKENHVDMGFIFQQLCLYLQSIDIGNCWVGLASPKKKNSDFVISIAFGKSDDFTRTRDKFKRKSLSKISDVEDERLIPAQLAPSSINSQPWYFTHNDDGSYNVYRVNRGILRNKFMGKWNKVDIGIALAHLYVSNEETFEFYIEESPKELKNYFYSGTFRI